MKDARRQTPDAKGLRNGERVRHPGQLGWSRHLGRFGFSKAASQTGEHSLDVLQLTNDRRHIVLVGHPQEHGHKQVGLQLRSRTQCDIDKPAELAISEAAASLGDVGCDRHRRPPTLRDEPESLGSRKRVGYPIDPMDNHATSLPDLELPKVLHPPLVPLIPVEGNTLWSGDGSLSVIANPSANYRRSSVLLPASSVSPLSGFADPSATPQPSGVWRLASSVPSPTSTAIPS